MQNQKDKVLYPLIVEDGSKTTVCKRCQHKKIASLNDL
jgi:hypothetical protein